MSDMGTVRITMGVENLHRPGVRIDLADVMVDTGSELTWIPRELLQQLGITVRWRRRFIVADGRTLERDVGYAMLHAAGASTVDDVVFAETSDMTLLGSRTLEGLNLKIDVARKELVPAGPIITAASPAATVLAA